MGRKSKKDMKAAADALIDTGAEMAMAAEPVDHHSQLGSWEAEAAIAEVEAVLDELKEPEPHEIQQPAHEGMVTPDHLLDSSVLTSVNSPTSGETEVALETPTAEETRVEEILSGLTDDDATLEAEKEVVAVLEAQASTGVETEAVSEAPAEDQPTQSFDEVIEALPAEKVDEMVIAIDEAFKDRSSFEVAKDPTNDNIHRTLKKAQKLMVTRRAAQVMLACNVSAGVVNRSIHEGSCYNVYALGKLADAIYGLTGGIIGNAINKACMRSLFKFKAADMAFTGEMARAAASDKIRVSEAVKKCLVRHTVSSSTAPTQASSTMQALETLGIVERSGSHKNPTFALTTHPVVERLAKALEMAA